MRALHTVSAFVLLAAASAAQAPSLTSVSPTSAASPGNVTILGANFTAGSTVTIDGSPATVVTVAASTIIAQPAPGTPGFVDVTVVTSGGSATAFNLAPLWPTLTASSTGLGGVATLRLENGFGGNAILALGAGTLASPLAVHPLVWHGLLLDPTGPIAVLASGPLDVAGNVTLALPIPNDPGLAGVTVDVQGYADQPFGPSVIGSFSNAAALPLDVPLPPPSALSYSDDPVCYALGLPIRPNIPTVTGIVTSWSLAPALPSGLVFDPLTGVISGTPSATTAAANYTVTASNSGGSTQTQVNIAVGIFDVVSLNLATGQIWELNRALEIGFNADLDFSTVSANTVQLRSALGVPVVGTFQLKRNDADGDGIPDTTDPKTLVFQPRCPTLADLSDAGFQPSTAYSLLVPGLDTGASLLLRSIDGKGVATTQTRNFTTPTSPLPGVLFLDTKPGPPAPVVRPVGALVATATYIEIGGDDTNRVYVELDPTTLLFQTNPPGFVLPRNRFADPAGAVAVLLELDQPIDPSPTNLDASRVGLETQDAGGAWRPFPTITELVSNCTDTGATLRLTPFGVLPRSARLRVALQAGFTDIVGEALLLPLSNVVDVPTAGVAYTSLTPGDVDADEVREEFDVGGDTPGSLEDTAVSFVGPTADWSNGRLTATIDFDGTGGPGGNFDWVIPAGSVFVFDTTQTTMIGSPNEVPTSIQVAVNGRVDVRDLVVEPGATLRIQGPNPFLLNATGDVFVRGTVDASGFDARDVATLNTGDIPEPGGPGGPGGGVGGTASWITTSSTPFGAPGDGPGILTGAGAAGGESGYSVGSTDNRRPGGGGGGRFARNQGVFIAQVGWNGHPSSRGAITGLQPSSGGVPNVGPFVDADPSNDFFGKLQPPAGPITVGELSALHGGYGGGGGGDAVPSSTFPHPAWSAATDEKGGGGGGGGGSVHLRVLGRIVFGNAGQIRSNGGRGATGENTSGLNHVGGSGGGGSAGHLVIESATQIDFTDGDPVSAPLRDYLLAVGAAGGVGWSSSSWSQGGAGGPGVIQVHVPDPNDIAASTSAAIVRPVLAFAGLFDLSAPDAVTPCPSFGTESRARSVWIPVAGADQLPGGGAAPVAFRFEGVEVLAPNDGYVQTTAGVVAAAAAVLGPLTLGASSVALAPDGVTLTIGAADLGSLINDTGTPSADMFLRNAALMERWSLRLANAGAVVSQDFEVLVSTYDDAAVVLTLVLDGSAGTPQAFVDAQGGAAVSATLIPRWFRVLTNGVPDALPDTHALRVLFQGAAALPSGLPDEATPLVDWTGDLAQFNALTPGALRFFRFEVALDLDALKQGASATAAPLSLEFLRIPFRF